MPSASQCRSSGRCNAFARLATASRARSAFSGGRHREARGQPAQQQIGVGDRGSCRRGRSTRAPEQRRRCEGPRAPPHRCRAMRCCRPRAHRVDLDLRNGDRHAVHHGPRKSSGFRSSIRQAVGLRPPMSYVMRLRTPAASPTRWRRHAARGAGEDRAHGVRHRRVAAHQTAVRRRHGVEIAAIVLCAQALHERRDIAAHDRREIGVHRRCREPLELAHFGQDLARTCTRTRRAGAPSGCASARCRGPD